MKEIRYCEKCGERLDDSTGLCPVCDIDTLNRVVKSGGIISKLAPVIYLTLFIVFSLFIVNAYTNGTVANHFSEEVVKHYISNDVDWLVKHTCSNYTFINVLNNDAEIRDNITFKIGQTATEINEQIKEKGYSISYEIVSTTDISSMILDEYNNNNPNSGITATEVNRTLVRITADRNGLTASSELTIDTINEGRKWKILSFS